MHISVLEFPKPITDDTFISLLSIHSLKTHYNDLRYDIGITDSDVIAPTETFVRPSGDIDFIQRTFDSFDIIRQDHHDHNLSLAICTRNQIQLSKKLYFPQVNGFFVELRKNLIIPLITLLLLYRSHSHFVQSLAHIISNHRISTLITLRSLTHLH